MFLNQNSGSKQNVVYQFSKFFDQMLLFCSITKSFLNYLNVLFCLWKTLAQFVTFCFDSLSSLKQQKRSELVEKFGNSSQKFRFVSFGA